jgi:hypothetical protein
MCYVIRTLAVLLKSVIEQRNACIYWYAMPVSACTPTRIQNLASRYGKPTSVLVPHGTTYWCPHISRHQRAPTTCAEVAQVDRKSAIINRVTRQITSG